MPPFGPAWFPTWLIFDILQMGNIFPIVGYLESYSHAKVIVKT